ncbi:hypothetical protein JHK85_053315 [Glycine max]|nr:hypothetical protein JHK85_053315 [Glycine max]
MVPWNSFPLEVIYQVLGWLAFLSWSVAGYPQLILNFRRKSVVGLSLDYEILNLTKHFSYLIYNASLFFVPAVQKQYFEKYGHGQMIPVAANDVAFSTHSVIVHLIILSQIAMFERGSQKFSKYAIAIVVVVWFSAAICFFIALPSQSWLWLISIFKKSLITYLNSWGAVYISVGQLHLVLIGLTLKSNMKSEPIAHLILAYSSRLPYSVSKHAYDLGIWLFFLTSQFHTSVSLAFMNFLRKSTDGFSIGTILLDFSGGIFNYSQMVVQSIDQGSWVNFYGNIGKVLISLVTIFYDSILMCQHYVLYPENKKGLTSKNSEEIKQPLISASPIDQQIKGSLKSSHQSPAEL